MSITVVISRMKSLKKGKPTQKIVVYSFYQYGKNWEAHGFTQIDLILLFFLFFRFFNPIEHVPYAN